MLSTTKTNVNDVINDITKFFIEIKPLISIGIKKEVGRIAFIIASQMQVDSNSKRRSDGRYIDPNRTSPPTLRVESGALKRSLLAISRGQTVDDGFYVEGQTDNEVSAVFGSNVNDDGFFYGAFHDEDGSKFAFFFQSYLMNRERIVVSVKNSLNKVTL